MAPLRHISRLLHISAVLARYRLDDILEAAHLFRPVRFIRLVPWGRRNVRDLSLGRRLRFALQELGPIFVKFGQILSTRRDLLPPEIADELALLQDQVEPFSSAEAIAAIEAALGEPVAALFDTIEREPLASASIAQVHAARLADGSDVVVKVLRPGVREIIERDVELIKIVARMAERYWSAGRNVRPVAIVAELERTIYDELDLQREAANASQLRRNFADSNDLYIPEVYWPYCKRGVMVMERVEGIPIDDLPALEAAGVDMERLARRGIEIFYTQVFRDNFFHADMHPGNILVDASDPADPSYIALDFGIVGALPPSHLYYLAENFAAFFDQDYYRIAVLHIEAGWVPDTIRVDVLESAVRTVCEPQFAKPLSEIKFADVLFQLFEVARRFNLIVQPELVLLQKTLLSIEGLGRQLYPELDIWATAKPILERILRKRHGLDATARDLRRRLPRWLERTPEMPEMIYQTLKRLDSGKLELVLHESDRENQLLERNRARRQTIYAIFSAGFVISASLLFGLDAPPRLGPVSIPGSGALALALLAAWRAWPRA